MTPPDPPTPPPEEPHGAVEKAVEAAHGAMDAATATTRTVLRATVRLYQHVSAYAILAMAFLGIFYFLLYFTINSNYARRAFNELVNGNVFRGSITWDRITWGPWPSELRIQRPVLSDSTGKTIIRVEEVDVSLDLLALTDGAIVGNDVIIDTPVVDFRAVPVEDEWGNPTVALNIAAMFLPPVQAPDDGSPHGAPTLKFTISEIRNARYSMDLPTIDVDARGAWISDAWFELRANPTGAGPVVMKMGADSVQVRDVSVIVPRTPGERAASKRPAAETYRWAAKGILARGYRWHDWGFTVEGFRSRLGPPFEEDRLEVRNFNLQLDPVRDVALAGLGHLELKDVGEHLSMFGVKGIAGPVTVDFQTAGELFSQAGSVQIASPGLTLPTGITTGALQINARHVDNLLDLQRISVDIAHGHVEGHVLLDGEHGRATAGLDLTDVVPATLPPLANVGGASPVSGGRPPGHLNDLLNAPVDGHVDAQLRDLWLPPPTVTAQLALRIRRPESMTLPLPNETRVTASAAWQGQRIDVRHLDVHTDTDTLDLVGDVDLAARTALAHVELSASNLSPWGALVGLPLRGRVSLQADVAGPFARPEAALDLTGTNVSWGELPTFSIDAHSRLAAGRLDIQRLEATAGDTLVSVKGHADVFRSNGPLDVTATVQNVDLAAWAPGVPVSGRAGVTLAARGTRDMPIVDATVTAEGAGYGPYPHGEVRGQMTLRGLRRPHLQIRSLDVHTPQGDVGITGGLELAAGLPMDLTVKIGGLDLRAIPLPAIGERADGASAAPVGSESRGVSTGISGRASATATVRGTLPRPTVAGEVEVIEPRFRTLQMARLRLKGGLEGTRVTVASLSLTDALAGPGVPQDHDLLTADGLSLELAPGADLVFEGHAVLDRVPASLVNHFVTTPLPVHGFLGLDVRASGTPQSPSGQGELTLEEGGYDNLDFGDARIKVAASDNRVKIDGELLDAAAQLSVSVPTTPGQGPATFAARFDDLALERHVPALREANLRAVLSGTLSGGIDLFAARRRPFAELEITDLRASTGRLELVTIEPIRASYADGDLTLTRLALQAAGQKLRAEGRLRATGAVEAKVEGDLDLSLLEGVLSSIFSTVQGQASLGLEVGGTLQNPLVQGQIRLTRAWLAPRMNVIGSEIELLEPVELRLGSSMGPAASPEADDQMGALELTLPRTVPDPSPGAKPGAIRPNRLVLRRDDGKLYIDTLAMGFKRFLPDNLRLQLDADTVSLLVPDVVRATFNAKDLVFGMSDMLHPNKTSLFLGGNIYLQRAMYTADIAGSAELNQGLKNNLTGTSQARTVSAFERVPMLQRFKVDLKVDGDNDIFVRNNVAVVALDLEIRPSIRVRGNLYNRPDLQEDEYLKIQGEVSTLPDTSHITYASRDFDVTQGQVDFDKGSFLDATLIARRIFKGCQDTSAQPSTTLAGTGPTGTTGGNGQNEETVTLELRFRLPGRNTTPVYSLNLSSDSGASNIDVATLVLTGACPSQLTAAASAQPALEQVLNPLLRLIEAPLEQTLDIDLNLTPGTGGTLFIEADKALSKRLRLYSYAPVGENDTGVKRIFGLEYQLNNLLFGDLSNEAIGLQNSTTGRLKLRLNLE